MWPSLRPAAPRCALTPSHHARVTTLRGGAWLRTGACTGRRRTNGGFIRALVVCAEQPCFFSQVQLGIFPFGKTKCEKSRLLALRSLMIQLEFSEDSPFQKGGAGRWAKINPFGSQVSVLPAHTVSSDGTGASFRGLLDTPLLWPQLLAGAGSI